MLKIINEGIQKGLTKKSLGIYVYSRLREELERDEVFRHCFNHYLVKHFDNLEKSKNVMAAFGDLLISYSNLYRKLLAITAKATSKVPFVGPLAESSIALGESLSELGEGIRRTIKKAKEP